MSASCSLSSRLPHSSVGWDNLRVRNDDTSVMYILPPGKPDTKNPLGYAQEDNRPRVDLSSAKKGHTCFYYALNLIRTRIGPNPPPEYQEARRIEKCISECRKQISQFNIARSWDKLKTVETFVQTALQHCKIAPNVNSLKGNRVKIFQALNTIEQKLSAEDKPGIQDAKSLINAFCKQSSYKNIYTYIQNAQMDPYYSIFKRSAAELGCDLKEIHRRHVEDILKTVVPETYQALSQKEKAGILSKLGMKALLSWYELIKNEPSTLDTFFQEAAAEAYGFRKSSWTPYQPIESLIECLKSNGPHCVAGFHGRSWYSKPPTVQQTIEGRSIFGWDSGDRLPESYSSSDIGAKSLTSHTIVIIGAEKAGKEGETVFFIDPNDGSSVKDLEQQKIYSISYKSLTEHHDCLNIATIRTEHYQPSAGYALYYPK